MPTAPMICTGNVVNPAGVATWHAEDADWMVTTEWTLMNCYVMLQWYEEPEVFHAVFSAHDGESQILAFNLRSQFCCVVMNPRMLSTPLLLPCAADERLYTQIAARLHCMTAYEACEVLATQLPRLRQAFSVRLRGIAK